MYIPESLAAQVLTILAVFLFKLWWTRVWPEVKNVNQYMAFPKHCTETPDQSSLLKLKQLNSQVCPFPSFTPCIIQLIKYTLLQIVGWGWHMFNEQLPSLITLAIRNVIRALANGFHADKTWQNGTFSLTVSCQTSCYPSNGNLITNSFTVFVSGLPSHVAWVGNTLDLTLMLPDIDL